MTIEMPPSGAPLILAQPDFIVPKEGVHLRELQIDITMPDNQQSVSFAVGVWKRNHDPAAQLLHDIRHVRSATTDDGHFDIQQFGEHPLHSHGQAVFLSGYDASPYDIAEVYPACGEYFDTVIGLSHAGAPTTKIHPHIEPFDRNDFFRSGLAQSEILTSLISRGELNPDQGVTLICYSTGAGPILELAARNAIKINGIILISPGGMLDRSPTQLDKGAGKDTLHFFKQWVHDSIHKKNRRPVYNQINQDRTLETARAGLSVLVTKSRNTWDRVRQRFLQYDNNVELAKPENAGIRRANKLFELAEYTILRLPFVASFTKQMHSFWANQPYHIEPSTPTTKETKRLVAINSTADACRKISKIPIACILGTKDSVLPPTDFLTTQDIHELSALTYTSLATEVREEYRRINEQRIQNGSHAFTESEILQDFIMSKTYDRIIERVKERFPNNTGNVTVLLSDSEDSTHLLAKTGFMQEIIGSAIHGLYRIGKRQATQSV